MSELKDKSVGLRLTFVWLASLGFIGFGYLFSAYIVGSLSSSNDPFVINLNMFLLDAVITVVGIFVAIRLTLGIGYRISINKQTVRRMVLSLFFMLLGFLLGQYNWLTVVGNRTYRTQFPWVVIALIFEFALYGVASAFVFNNKDQIRSRVWTYTVYALIIAIPSIVVVSFVK